MSPQLVVFVLLAVVGGVSAVAVVTARNLVHAALFLAVSFGSMAGVFLVLAAEFLAMVQLLVYVGAIAVLLLFGLMLTRAPIGREALDSQSKGLGLIVSVALFGVLAALIVQAYGDVSVTLTETRTAPIGEALFSRWVLPFEVASMLLLSALIGAIVLSRRESGESGDEDVNELGTAANPEIMGGPEGMAQERREADRRAGREPAAAGTTGAGTGGST